MDAGELLHFLDGLGHFGARDELGHFDDRDRLEVVGLGETRKAMRTSSRASSGRLASMERSAWTRNIR